jgi:2'-5' RNA ligase
VAGELHGQLAPFRVRHPDARWTPASKLHLTLVFLGATAPSDVELIDAAVAQVAAGWAPFEVSTGGGGGYLGRRGGVAWLEVDDGRTEAVRLSLAVDAALESRAYEARPPRPHLTLARRVSDALLGDVAAAAADLRTAWRVDRAVLYRSYTGPGSADYEALSTHLLSG